MSKRTPKTKHASRERRHARVRGRVSGTIARPRLAVFRSNTTLYAQLIDDAKGHTLASASSAMISKGTTMEKASGVGETIAKAAGGLGITRVVFDRGGFTYTGRIKALADAVRKGGLTF